MNIYTPTLNKTISLVDAQKVAKEIQEAIFLYMPNGSKRVGDASEACFSKDVYALKEEKGRK